MSNVKLRPLYPRLRDGASPLTLDQADVGQNAIQSNPGSY
jgi:hypothetical protein